MGYQQCVPRTAAKCPRDQADGAGHPIADVHPGNLDEILFPGQDYNNARIYDFEDVKQWENNKRESHGQPAASWHAMLTAAVDRTRSARMGWSDVAISLSGPIVHSLMVHFTQRW